MAERLPQASGSTEMNNQVGGADRGKRPLINLKRRQETPTAVASKTGQADAGDGSVAVSGTVVGDINLYTRTPVRTRYLEQVLRIVPQQLIGRDAELAELAEFCTSSESLPTYFWWRGEAWAGKSALISWFVLNPPQGIQIISFFITARFASQDNRNAFIENMIEQLATLLDEPIPAYLTDSTRDAHLLGMLSDAANACKARSERLVLVVDGLDEDRGVTTGPHAYSIAALLPDPPPADMRIIVTGRPNPPIPTDVPERHHLRDPSIVRQLSPSPFAEVVRSNMEGELKRLLLGTQGERDLLGFLTAAGGGLSGSDLAELTNRPTWQVEDELQTVTGRSFSTRPSRWLPGIRPDVYVLGHEELQDTARNYLGSSQLTAYQLRLHTWADQYREMNWPEETPEYLMRGYYRMLIANGDLERILIFATDQRRHDRMLKTSGGDNAALEEISAAQSLIVRNSEPDLVAMARLAVIRDYLADRNTMIPVDLPAAWAALGQEQRAKALARSITDSGRRALSLVELVKAVTATSGFRQAQPIAQSISQAGRRGEAMMVIFRAAVMVGDYQSAETLVQEIPFRGEQTFALIVLAQAAAEAGRIEQARGLIAQARKTLNLVAYPRRRGEALANLAQALAATGDMRQARSMITKAKALVHRIDRPSWQGAVWAAVVRAVAAVDGQHQAQQVIRQAEAWTQSIADISSRVAAMASLARTVNAIGENAEAQTLITTSETLVRSIDDPNQQAAIWVTLIRAAGLIGVERTASLVDEAESISNLIEHKEARATALAALSRAVTSIGELERAGRLASEAEDLTRSIINPEKQVRNMATLTKAAAAVENLNLAAEIAQSIGNSRSRYRADALISAAKAVATTRDYEHAKTIVQSITYPDQQAGALAALAKTAAALGDLSEAEEIAGSITRPVPQAEALIGLASGTASLGDLDQAEIVARSIKPARQRSSAFVVLAGIATAAKDRTYAASFIEQAEGSMGSIAKRYRAEIMAALVKTLAEAGNLDLAEEIVESVDGQRQQAEARAAIVKTAATIGDIPRADRAALAIEDKYWHVIAQLAIVDALAATENTEDAYRRILSIQTEVPQILEPSQQQTALIGIMKALVVAGHPEQAEAIIPTISLPVGQAEALAALSEITDPAYAPSLVAQALQLAHWTTSLAALIKIRPDALEIIVDKVTEIASDAESY